MTVPRRTLLPLAVASSVLLGGCGLMDVARPQQPDIAPATKVAASQEEASDFLVGYSERLGAALGAEGEGLDAVQEGPLLDRTRAEIAIYQARGETLAPMSYVDMVPAAPTMEAYPLWFLVVANSEQLEGHRQIMLVQRQAAEQPWRVAQTAVVPEGLDPVFLGAEDGAVEPATADFVTRSGEIEDQMAQLLSGGEGPGEGVEFDAEAFGDYTGYVQEFADAEDFDDVSTSCAAYEDTPLLDKALTTEAGAITLGEVRCTLKLSVAEDFALNLGEDIEAVMTGDGQGNQVSVVTSHPIVISQVGEGYRVDGADWHMIESFTE